MGSIDIVALSLSAPMEWKRFEDMVYSILLTDDLPRLRKLGGGHDEGIDSQSESFFANECGVDVVVQVTSQRAQLLKLKDTLAKLRKLGLGCKHLVMVFQHPVSSEVRTRLIKEATADSIAVDIRDQQYLITQLSKPGSPIFARYFRSPAEQIKRLLETSDPLEILSSKERHALLASLGAYVLGPRSRLTRTTLFDKTVLAVVVASDRSSLEAIVGRVKELLPSEPIDVRRVSAALEQLRKDNAVKPDGSQFVPTEAAIASLGQVIQQARLAYDSLIAYVVDSCRRFGRIDDATKGYIERNIRRGLLSLFRTIGPLAPEELERGLDLEIDAHLVPVISRDLSSDMARQVLAALSTFLENPENQSTLLPFVRSYAALAIRNLDPVGRAWQKGQLSRRIIALDTDAVLSVLIEELPGHLAITGSLRNLIKEGVRVVITPDILHETADHIARADRTFRHVSGSLLRMPASAVDSEISHAIVRGYYYAVQQGYGGSPTAYWFKYFSKTETEQYIRFQLLNRIAFTELELQEIPQDWSGAFEELRGVVMRLRERSRKKAEYRTDEFMEARVSSDVKMALHLSMVPDPSQPRTPRGYLASEDRAFPLMEGSAAWDGREHVSLPTRGVPGLAEFICGSPITEDEVTKLLLDPVFVAAAEQLAEEMFEMTALGIDLKSVPLDRLEWDLSCNLRSQLRELRLLDGGTAASPSESQVASTLRILQTAMEAGYRLEPGVEELARRYHSKSKEAVDERNRRQKAESQLRALATAAKGETKRSRRRINAILRDLGIQLEMPEEMTESDAADALGSELMSGHTTPPN